MNFNTKNLAEFSEYLQDLSYKIGFKVSSRGWAYLLETRRLINKDEFDKITNLVNRCRKEGYLPIDFVAEQEERSFKGIESPSTHPIKEEIKSWLEASLESHAYYTPDWWDGEKYYIQMLVEKIDLITLFSPVCSDYHIPIATSKGWSSMLQRADYAKRFKKAETKGMKCVLLYCGDHDPDGLRISEFIRKNLNDLRNITWSEGTPGYNPENLIIDRFGLNYDFIEENNLTWIDNLVTGSGNILARNEGGEILPGLITQGKNAGKPHQNFYMDYMQDYLNKYGVRKCEANAIVTMPEASRNLVENAIIKYLGIDALDRFRNKRLAVKVRFENYLEETKLADKIIEIINSINNG